MKIKRDRWGGRICKHNRAQSSCKECGGKRICPHNRIRYTCKECGGKGICGHGRRRSHCKECGGFLTLAQEMYNAAKHRSKKDNHPFNIMVGDIVELIGIGICPVLGTPYNLTFRKVADTSASLDKFIPSLGYAKGNCAVISNLANSIKRNATMEQVYCVANWMKLHEFKQ